MEIKDGKKNAGKENLIRYEFIKDNNRNRSEGSPEENEPLSALRLKDADIKIIPVIPGLALERLFVVDSSPVRLWIVKALDKLERSIDRVMGFLYQRNRTKQEPHEYFLLIDEKEKQLSTMSPVKNLDEPVEMVNNKTDIYSICQAEVSVELTVSLDLVFELTAWGERIYAFYTGVEEEGLLTTLFNTGMSFISTGDVPRIEKEWSWTHWESGTLLEIVGLVVV